VWTQGGIAHAGVYHVSQDGHDANNGLSWEQAWRTLEHAGETARAGDLVIIRKGREPYQYLPVKHSGTQGNPIVFRGEHQDSLPVITGGLKESNWRSSDIERVWHIRTSAKPILLMEDQRPLTPARTRACVDGNWYWESGELFYRPTTGDPRDHDVWRAANGGGIQLGSNSWVIVEDFECWLGQGACIGIDKGSNNIIRRIHARWHARGLQIRGGHHNFIEASVFEHNREGVYLLNNAANNTIIGCKALHNGNWPPWQKGDRSGIAIGEVGVNVGNSIIDNEVAYNGGPDSDPGLIAYTAPETTIEGNDVHDNYYGGILIGILSHRSSAIGNRVYRNGKKAVLAGEGNVSGLSVRRSGGVIVKGNEILDNYVSFSDPGRYVDRAAGGLDLKGNKEDEMRGIQLIDNVVCGTQNGPDLYLSREPDTTGLLLRKPERAQCQSDTGPRVLR
jgi:parallel beta-helix repeat protein